MAIDPSQVQWDDDKPDPAAVKWDEKPSFKGVRAKTVYGKGVKPRGPATYNLTGVPGVSTQIGGLLDAFQHRAMDVPHAVAQFVGHGVQAATDRLPDGNPIRDYVRRNVAGDDAAMRKREADYQARTAGNMSSNIGAAAGYVAPAVAGIGALRAAGVLPQVTSRSGKLAMLVGEGAATGATQPVLGDAYWKEKGVQTGVGAVTAPLAVAGIRATQGVTNVARHALQPGRVADANIARMYGANPEAIQQLRNFPEHVPGEVPSAAQVLRTPEAVQAERTLRNNPATASAFASQDAANNTRRLDVVRGLAGDEEALQAAVQARRSATQPYRQANLPEEGSPPVDPAPVLETLRRLSNSANPTVRSAANEHLGLIEAQMVDGKVPAYVLDDIRQEAGGMLAKHAPQGVVGSKVSAKYGPVTDQIADTLDGSVPGYRNYLAAYADTSQPINTMESVGKLLDPNAPGGLDVTGNPMVGAARLKQVLRGDDKARYPMADDARLKMEGVRESLARRSISDNKLAASGPGTAADLQTQGGLASMIFGQNMGRSGGWLGRSAGAGLGGLVGSIFGPAGVAVGTGVGMGITDAIGAINQRAASRVGETAASAPATAEAMERYLQQNKPALLDYLLYGKPLQQLPPPR